MQKLAGLLTEMQEDSTGLSMTLRFELHGGPATTYQYYSIKGEQLKKWLSLCDITVEEVLDETASSEELEDALDDSGFAMYTGLPVGAGFGANFNPDLANLWTLDGDEGTIEYREVSFQKAESVVLKFDSKTCVRVVTVSMNGKELYTIENSDSYS